MARSIFIIEDEDLLGEELLHHFRAGGWEARRAAAMGEARAVLFQEDIQPDVVLSDLSLPDGMALDLLREARELGHGGGEWIFLTGYGTVPDSVKALRLGAHDFLEKPCSMDHLDLVVEGALRSSRAQRRIRDEAHRKNRRYSPDAYLGSSSASREVRAMVARLSEVPLNSVVLGGETGTGKGLAARILHYSGVRASGPLVEVNCAALPRDLLESELFGHEAGAFTGAKGRHRGLFEQAHGGTLFLDEVSELPRGLQAKLLKAVEDRRIRRVGGESDLDVDVQLFAASNRDLARVVEDGTFRQDLYHRLSVFTLELPPLRRRLEDLEDLVPSFIAEFNALSGKRVEKIPERVWERLREYSWPGNVRELKNVLERSVLLAHSHVLPLRWLQLSVLRPPGSHRPSSEEGDSIHLPLDGSRTLDEMEAIILREALERRGFNVAATARALGTTRQTLRYRIEKHGIEMRSGRSGGDRSIGPGPSP
jgi:DNA-binding NtrC family response regulator